jgi:hypothetical protein
MAKKKKELKDAAEQTPEKSSQNIPQKVIKKTRPGYGAPSLEYTDEMGRYVCRLIAKHTGSLEALCKANPNIPGHDTLYDWKLDNPKFAEMFWQAKREQVNLYALETLAIADDRSRDFYIDDKGNEKPNAVAVARDALRIKERQWHAARLAPKVWGDRPADDLAAKNSELQATTIALQAQLLELQKKNERDY